MRGFGSYRDLELAPIQGEHVAVTKDTTPMVAGTENEVQHLTDLSQAYSGSDYKDPRVLAEETIRAGVMPYHAADDGVEANPEFEALLEATWHQIASAGPGTLETEPQPELADRYVQTFLQAYAFELADIAGYSETAGFWKHDQKDYDGLLDEFTVLMYVRNGAVSDDKQYDLQAEKAAAGATTALGIQDLIEDGDKAVAAVDPSMASVAEHNGDEPAYLQVLRDEFGIVFEDRNTDDEDWDADTWTVEEIWSHPNWKELQELGFNEIQEALNLPTGIDYRGETLGSFGHHGNKFYQYHTAGHEAANREALDAAGRAGAGIAADDPADAAVAYIRDVDEESLKMIGLDAHIDTDADAAIPDRYETAADVCMDIALEHERRARFILLSRLLPEDTAADVIDHYIDEGFVGAVKTHDYMSTLGHPQEEIDINSERMRKAYYELFIRAIDHLYEDTLNESIQVSADGNDGAVTDTTYDETATRLYGLTPEDRPSLDLETVSV